ncbi:MAG: LacI family DNA-binding transcriptional regulator [Pleomorphochaeta sp.]
MATIYDVAEKSGFSAATVSKVFNRYQGVNAKTKEKILITARELGYTPTQSAQALVTKKSWLIGVIFQEDLKQGFVHPHFSEILEAFKSEMEKAGYDIIFINRNFPNQNMRYLEHCRYRNIDGVLFASSTLDIKEAIAINNIGIKCVSVETKYPKIPTILSTNYEGSFEALKYLYSLGHRKIGYLGSPLSSLSGIERFEAYKAFLKEFNLPYDKKIIDFCENYTPQEELERASSYIERNKNDLPTAIFASHDRIAITLQKTLISKGISVPNDISIIGFDDIEITNVSTPALTTVKQFRSNIGIKAAELMKDLLNNKPIESKEIFRINTQLILRDSTCRARII